MGRLRLVIVALPVITPLYNDACSNYFGYILIVNKRAITYLSNPSVLTIGNNVADVDKNAMIRNRYDRIPLPSPDTAWETLKTTYCKTAQAKCQEVSSFLADVNQTILNKINKSSKTNSTRTNNYY